MPEAGPANIDTSHSAINVNAVPTKSIQLVPVLGNSRNPATLQHPCTTGAGWKRFHLSVKGNSHTWERGHFLRNSSQWIRFQGWWILVGWLPDCSNEHQQKINRTVSSTYAPECKSRWPTSSIILLVLASARARVSVHSRPYRKKAVASSICRIIGSKVNASLQVVAELIKDGVGCLQNSSNFFSF